MRTHAQNQFDSIDLSDNAVVRLEGFPRLPRLKQLLLHNNRIARIGKNCHGERGTSCVQVAAPHAAGGRRLGRGMHTRRLSIPTTCAEPIPNLEVLMLTNNKLTNLQVSSAAAAVLLMGSLG